MLVMLLGDAASLKKFDQTTANRMNQMPPLHAGGGGMVAQL